MNKIRKVFIGIFLSLIFPVTGLAEYQIYGAGASSSCGEWVNERKTGSWREKGHWMLGAISAVGYYSVYDLKNTDSQALVVWMDNYCQKNPLNDFREGVYYLVEVLAIKKP